MRMVTVMASRRGGLPPATAGDGSVGRSGGNVDGGGVDADGGGGSGGSAGSDGSDGVSDGSGGSVTDGGEGGGEGGGERSDEWLVTAKLMSAAVTPAAAPPICSTRRALTEASSKSAESPSRVRANLTTLSSSAPEEGARSAAFPPAAAGACRGDDLELTLPPPPPKTSLMKVGKVERFLKAGTASKVDSRACASTSVSRVLSPSSRRMRAAGEVGSCLRLELGTRVGVGLGFGLGLGSGFGVSRERLRSCGYG